MTFIKSFFSGREWLALAVLSVLILVVFPLTTDIFRLNLIGKYMTYAFVALGLVLCWGHCGILSLGGMQKPTIRASAGCCGSIQATTTHPTFF